MSQEDPYRCYYFGNRYMSSIQQGIQSNHATSELFRTHPYEGNHLNAEVWSCEHLYTWAKTPTVILLEGGGSRRDGISGTMNQYEWMLRTLGRFLNYPVASFREPEMEDCLSSVGIVVPDEIYEMKLEEQCITLPGVPSELDPTSTIHGFRPNYRALTFAQLYSMAMMYNETQEAGRWTDVQGAKILLHCILKSARLAS